MSQSMFDQGITKLARNDWSGQRDTPSPEQQSSNFHVGIVMDDQDDQRMGRVWVYLPGVSTRRFDEDALPNSGTAPDRKTGRLFYDEKLRIGWVLCYPMMPFFGSDDHRVEEAPDGRNAKKRDPNAYGMWFQPRIGDHVGVMYAYGEVAHAFWMGMIPKQYRNYSVPGQAGETLGNVVGGLGCAEAINPAYEKVRSEEDPDPTPRRIVLGYTENLLEAGIICDLYRGSGIAGAQRESPSYVFGIKSAGWVFDSEKENLNVDGTQFNGGAYQHINTQGHQIIMDDHPDHQAVRIRTSYGSQLYFNDAGEVPYIFMNTPKGNMWLEMTDNGDVNLFCDGNFSVHAKKDINLTADRDFSIEAQRDLRFLVRRDTSIELKGEVHVDIGANDLPPVCLNYDAAPDWGKGPERDLFWHNWANVHWKIEEEFHLEVVKDWHIIDGMDILIEAVNIQTTLSEDWLLQARYVDIILEEAYIISAKGMDITLEEGYFLATDTYDVTAWDSIEIQAIGAYHNTSGEDFRIYSGGNTDIYSAEQIRETAIGTIGVTSFTSYLEEAPVIHMNGPTPPEAAIAETPVLPVIPSTPELPIIPDPPIVAELTTVWDCPIVAGIPDCCIDPPETDFLGRIIPQHFPWPDATVGLVDAYGGVVTVNDVRSPLMVVIPEGAAEAGAEAPLGGILVIDGVAGYYEGKPYETDSPAENPQYDPEMTDDDPPQIIDPSINGDTKLAKDYNGEVSDEMVDFLKKEEGFRETPYRDGEVDGVPMWSVGYGHQINVGDVINGKVITAADIAKMNATNGKSISVSKEEGERLLRMDIKEVTDTIEKNVNQQLTQGQYDALVSLGYNIGTGALKNSTLLKRINEGNFPAVPKEWMRWTKSGGKENRALRRRRKRELTRWFNKYVKNGKRT